MQGVNDEKASERKRNLLAVWHDKYEAWILQQAYDLWHAQKKRWPRIERLPEVNAAA